MTMSSIRGWKVVRLGIVAIVLLLAATIACQAATVTGLAVKKVDEKVEIHLTATGPLSYKVLSRPKPRQALVLEMPSTSVLKNAMRTIQIDKGIVERAIIQQYQPGVARLTLEVLQPVKYYVKSTGNGLILIVSTQTIAAKVSKAVPKMAAGEPTIESPEPVKPEVEKAPKINVAYKHKNLLAKKKPAFKRPKPVKLVSLDFVNADLIYVLKLLAKELNVNLVTDSSVTGSVTMSLKNVSAQTAMNIIIALNGFKQKKLGNILFVGSEETMNVITPDLITWVPLGDLKLQVFPLKHMSAGDAVAQIKAQYPLVSAKEGAGSTVIVQADDDTLKNIRNLITGVDVKPASPEDSAGPLPEEKLEVVKVKYASANDVTTILQKLLGEDAPAVMEVDKRLNAIIFKGYAAQIAKAKETLDSFDLPLQQVMLAVKVVDLSENGAKNLGVSWQVGAEDGTKPIKFYEVPSTYPKYAGSAYNPYAETAPATAAPMPIGFFVRDPFVLQASLSMQVSSGEAKVLASPRVATISGKQATLHIGEKYPIVYYDPRAGQYQVIYVDIGIKLTVKPTISDDGYILTEIQPTVSNLLELINQQYPRTAERSADVTVRVKDGNTIVIGGMVDENDRTTVTKVPLLGDIPILGQMFRSVTTDHSKKEVVIMITPKIIRQ